MLRLAISTEYGVSMEAYAFGMLKIPVSGVRLPPQPPASLLHKQLNRTGARTQVPRPIPHTFRACIASPRYQASANSFRSSNLSRIRTTTYRATCQAPSRSRRLAQVSASASIPSQDRKRTPCPFSQGVPAQLDAYRVRSGAYLVCNRCIGRSLSSSPSLSVTSA